MNTKDGYAKLTLDNTKVLLAGGGDKSITDICSINNGIITINGTTITPLTLLPDRITAKATKILITGTGTVGLDKGEGNNPRYFPSLWKFNTGLTVSDGDIYVIKIPVSGHDYGVYISIDNGSNYYPVSLVNNGRLTTHFSANKYIMVAFESFGATDYVMEYNGSNARVNKTGGCWRVINFYDTNDSARQLPTSTNATYRVLFSGTADDNDRTETTRKSSGLTFNPSTNYLNVGTKVGIYSDSEGGNIKLTCPDSYKYYTNNSGTQAVSFWEMDAYNGNLRFYTFSGGDSTHSSPIKTITFRASDGYILNNITGTAVGLRQEQVAGLNDTTVGRFFTTSTSSPSNGTIGTNWHCGLTIAPNSDSNHKSLIAFYGTDKNKPLYIRTQSTTWGDWRKVLDSSNYTDYVYSKSTSDDRYVNITGDTMTGPLYIKRNASDTNNKLAFYADSEGGNITIYSPDSYTMTNDTSTIRYYLIDAFNGNFRIYTETTGACNMVFTNTGYLSTTGQGTLWGASNDGSESGLDADLLDGWHRIDIQPTGYITSNTENLSSYWGKIWEITITNKQYSDRDIILLASSAYTLRFGIILIRIRQEGGNDSGAYNFTKHVKLVAGNIPLDDVKLYCNNSTGKCELWMNVRYRYGVYNVTILKKSGRISQDEASMGTLYSTSFTTVQTPPALSDTEIVTMTAFTSNISISGNAATATSATYDSDNNEISTYYQPKVSALGSTNKPVYISAAGTFAECSAYPTSLPASDVYSWAKAASKPSYNLDEVSDGSTRKLSNYLPLSGGTLTGTGSVLIINRTNDNPLVKFKYNGTTVGYLGVKTSGEPMYSDGDTNYNLIHSGNVYNKTSGVGVLNKVKTWAACSDIPTINTIALWDGRYQSTGNRSNLKYMSVGEIKNAATLEYATTVNNNDTTLPTGKAVVDYVAGKTWVGTLSLYDAITNKDSNVFYFIIE